MIPRKDAALAAFSTNFNTRIVASPATFGLTASQCAQYTPLHDGFIAAYNAANQSGSRSRSLVTAKDSAKSALLAYARELYGFIASSLTVLDSDKVLVGVTVRKAPTPQPPPADPPAVDVVSVIGRAVTVRLHDSVETNRRGRPPGVSGASIYTFTGTTPPADIDGWTSQGLAGKTVVQIVFPSSVAPGAQVWIKACWFNNRKQPGPFSEGVTTYLQGGSAAAA